MTNEYRQPNRNANKTLGTRFLVSEVLFNQVPQALVEVRRAQAVLKGKLGTFPLVEAIGFAAPDSALLVQSTIGILFCNTKNGSRRISIRVCLQLLPRKSPLSWRHGEPGQDALRHAPISCARHESPRYHYARLTRFLGRRHDGYGVAAEHYPAFRQAFLESARGIFGEKHTPQVEKAWADMIDMITKTMLGPVAAQTSNQTSEALRR